MTNEGILFNHHLLVSLRLAWSLS